MMAQTGVLLQPGKTEENSLSLQLIQQVLATRVKVGGLNQGAPQYDLAYDFQESHLLDWFLKRALDISASILTIIVFSPLFLLIALLIRIDSHGPILFSQVRVGYRGKRFHMYKFRSMSTDAEDRLKQLLQSNENEVMFKLKEDPRVTRIGKILRKFSLDEFPQLINVLRGEMSLVGPRPPLPREVSQYEPWHFCRFSTLPGLTGTWQVFGRSSIQNFDHVVALDFHYLENFSIFKDIELILRTIPAVILAKGSY